MFGGRIPVTYVLHSFTQVYDYLCTRLRIRNEDMRLWSMEDEVCILYVIAQCNMMRTWSDFFLLLISLCCPRANYDYWRKTILPLKPWKFVIIMLSLLKVGSQRLLNDRAAQWNLIDELCGYCTFFKSTWHVVYHNYGFINMLCSSCCFHLWVQVFVFCYSFRSTWHN